jgi:Ca2+-binding RTX toxin-like protein
MATEKCFMRHFLARLFGPRANTNRQSRRTKPSRPQLGVEALEGRWVPATLQIVNGLLTYTAGAGVANNVTVSLSGTTYTFRDTAETISVLGIPGATGSGTNTVTLPAAAVQPAGMSINLGDLNDRLSIESTANAIAVAAGDGNDTIDVGKVGGSTLSAVQAPVTVDGEAGTDTVRVNDPAAGVPRNYTVTATKVTATSGLDVNYVGMENLAVNAGILPNTFNVRATAAGTRTTINGGANGDTFNVGSTANTLDDIQGQLILNGGEQGSFGGQDVVNLFDQGSVVSRNYTLRANSVARSGAAAISYSGMEGLTLSAGSGADSVVVVGTAAGMPVTLNMGAGNDVVNLGTRTGSSLDGILSTVTVNGEAGTDSVILNDQVDDNGNSYGVTATGVTRSIFASSPTILNYATVESLALNAGNFNDRVSVQSTNAATPVALKLGGGDDDVTVAGQFGFTQTSLNTILGAVTVDGQDGSDDLIVDDRAGGYGRTYTVTATAVSRSDAASVVYAGLENLSVYGANSVQSSFPPPNRFLVKSTSAATYLGGPEGLADEFVVGSDGHSLDNILGSLKISGDDGVDSLVLDDAGDASGNSYTITSTSVARSGAALISFDMKDQTNSGLGSLTLNAGAGNDTVTVQSLGANVLATLNLGAGNDAVTLREGFFLPQILSAVNVNGQAGADAILVDATDASPFVSSHTYAINVTEVNIDNRRLVNYGTAESLTLTAGSGDDTINVDSALAATPVVVRGGAGNDVFRVGGSLPGSIGGPVTVDGQGGTDTLDYSAAILFGVRVNLELGTATGVGGGVSNVENVIGGQGNDIIVGNGQDNVLQGRAGRDILIGRGGADQIFGGAPSFFFGDGDDIVVGASTVHDLNPAALEDLMREWGRTDLLGTPLTQYFTRINHLLGVTPGGLNGTTTLDLSQTIDDGAADYLDGGTDLDWSFRFPGDTTLVEVGERVN